MQIIGFGHRRRVGKDTAAKFLITFLRQEGKYNHIMKAGFADKLKSQCCELYRWAGLMPGDWYEEPGNEHMKDTILPAIGKSPRQIWIEYGQFVRQIYPGTWTHFLFNRNGVDLLVVKDVRKVDEAEGILEAGGFCVRVDRPDVPISDDVVDTALDGWDHWTYQIQNDGSHAALYDQVVAMAGRLGL